MAGTTTNINIYIDNDNVPLNMPNKETIAAMLEAEKIAKDPFVKGYTNLEELFADLKK